MRRARRLTLTVLAGTVGLLACSAAPALASAPEAPEEVTVQAPVHATEATFHGFLNPKAPGSPGEYEFLYKKSPTECTGGSKAPSSPGISVGGEREEVSETVTGLEAGATYTVCLLARNGTKLGENEALNTPPVTFTTATPPEKPATSSPATQVTAGTATLHGVLNPTVEAETGWYFAYSPGAKCTSGGTGAGETEHVAPAMVKAESVEKEATGLEPNTAYKFCLIATNTAEEPTPGNEVALKTEPAPPTIASEYTGGVTASAATLDAEINPNNETTSDVFEYATSEAAVLAETGTKVAGSALSGYPQQLVSVPLTGLAPSSTYYYRVVAENAKSKEESTPVLGAVQQFTTVPTPSTEPVTAPTATTATFNGHLTPLNQAVTSQYRFSYNLGGGPCTGEQSTPTEEAGTGAGTEVKATANVTGLQPNHEYTVCLVTQNASGSQEGTPVHFTTAAVPVEILGESTPAVTPSEATLEAQVNPNNYKATYTFEYASSEAALGTPAATVLAGGEVEGFGQRGVSASTGAVLSVGETYYYRVIVTNIETSAVLDGQVQSFTPQGPPLLTLSGAQAITRTTATLPGTVNPAGVETTYYYQYGTTTAYGDNAPSAQGLSAGTGFTALPAPIGISGLTPATTYHYRLIATSTEGETTTPDQTFTTAPATPPAATTGEASNITLTTATVAGTINPEGLETSYELDLGIDTTYGTSIYGEAGSATTPTEVTLNLQNLAPGSTYHYRIVAINSDGRTYGADRTFTTPAYSNPITQPLTPPLIASPATAFPTETTNTAKPPLTRAQKLKAALNTCRKKHNRSKRQACERAAKKKYGPLKAKSKGKK